MSRIESKKRKISNKTKIRKIIIILIFILIVIGLAKLINNLIPVKNVADENIDFNLSTTEITGSNVVLSLKTNTKYNIYYYINTKDEEAKSLTEENSIYYEENLNNDDIEETETISEASTTSSIKTNYTVLDNIEDEQYQKLESETLDIEKNSYIYLKYERFGKLSNTPYVIEVNNIDKQGPEIGEIETSSTDSTITVTITAIDSKNSNLTYYFKLSDDTFYECTNSINTYTFTDLIEDETYTIYVKVKDGFGNETEVATDAVASSKVTSTEKKVYYFKVNLAANTVTVYDKDENGEYTEPIKAMICSTGKATPKSGKYKISYRYRWLALFGNVYGQYSVRIHGNILFHSVPYLDTYPDTLEYEEFDKLGTSASAGCIRLMVKDAKWIYDNAATGSIVEFYSDKNNPGPLGKPNAPKISDSEYKDWDPTDPDKRNPWNGGSGKVTKEEKTTTNTTTDKDKDTDTNNTNTTSNNVTNNTISNNTTNTSVNNTTDNNTIFWGTDD